MSRKFVLLLLLLSGCSHRVGPAIAPVSGRVLMDNKPLANAVVRFQPEIREGNPKLSPDSYGRTDEDGRYTLEPGGNRSDEPGALVGKHFVAISIFDRVGDGFSGPRERVPSQYNRESTLTFTVPPEGTDKADFDLKSR